jgi:hypothetical protein
LVRDAREWRRALKQLQDGRGWTTEQLREQLSEVGVHRELQTVDGWLRVEWAAPIGPQHLRKELEAMWPLINGHTGRAVGEVAEACGQLRSLRSAAGRALSNFGRGEWWTSVSTAPGSKSWSALDRKCKFTRWKAITFGIVRMPCWAGGSPQNLAERYAVESPDSALENSCTSRQQAMRMCNAAAVAKLSLHIEVARESVARDDAR